MYNNDHCNYRPNEDITMQVCESYDFHKTKHDDYYEEYQTTPKADDKFYEDVSKWNFILFRPFLTLHVSRISGLWTYFISNNEIE